MSLFHKKNKIFYFILTILFLLLLKNAQAANLYLNSTSNTVSLNNTFTLEVRLNLDQEKSINTVDVYLNYPADLLNAVDISYGNSILDIIPEQPTIDNQAGTIHFGGGITNGYTGKIPGDPGLSNLLTKIIFKTIKVPTIPGPIQIVLSPKSTVFLNDGLGTSTQLSLNNFALNITAPSNNPNNEWQLNLSQDKIPPEDFLITLSRDPLIYNNKYFITFNTTDKQTGIDYYQVKEGSSGWTKAISPYLLKDQNLGSAILVKAVDKAGNERIVQYVAPKIKATSHTFIIVIVLVILVLILIVICFLIRSLKASKILK